ncbi:MAG: hypothetical protein RQM95_03060 [Syntrophaceticus schinkii]
MEETNKKSWAALLVEVLTSPGAAFKEIAENPRFGAAAVTLTVINFVFAALTIPKVREFTLLTLENTPGLSPEDIEAASALWWRSCSWRYCARCHNRSLGNVAGDSNINENICSYKC